MDRREKVIVYGSAVLISLIALIALFGCGDQNVLKQGTVVERKYDDPDSWWSTMCVAHDPKTYACTFSMPVEEHDGPHWSVKVVGYDEDGKKREEWHGVTETLYDLAQVGVVVNFPEDRVVPQ